MDFKSRLQNHTGATLRRPIVWAGVVCCICVILLVACSTSKGLDGSSWSLTTYRDSQGNMADRLADSTVTIDFQADQVSGLSGCNNYTGPYQASGSKLEFGQLASTQKMCIRPEGVMQAEAAYLADLAVAAEYTLNGDTLEIKNTQGEQLLVFERATSQ